MRIRLTPQRREFFELLASASSNAIDVARLLVELLERFPQDGAELVTQIKAHEHRGDDLTKEVIGLLNRTFVTPFDRDDMYRLAGVLDDVCDHVDDSAEKVVGYGVREVNDAARQQALVIHRCTTKLADAIGQLEGFKDSRRQLIELRTLEDEGDRLSRQAISALFAGDPDAVSLVRWKDIHEQLEEAIDACENAADVLEAILVKNR
jgi:predicted phosphate transport protein (TIGR00153 family)